jgi:hypothetical protein
MTRWRHFPKTGGVKPNPRERNIQADVAQYLKFSLPEKSYFTAIPGGDGQATRAPGYRAGAPDIICITQGMIFFIELKSLGGRLSNAQVDTRHDAEAAGIIYIVARSIADVAEAMLDRGVNLRAELLG